MNVTIYIITLPSGKERLNSCLHSLDTANVPKEFIKIYSAKTYNDVSKDMLLDNSKDGVDIKLVYSRKIHITGSMVPNEIGCAYSHLSIYQDIVDHSYERAVILEDDAIVPADFLQRFEECCKINSSIFDLIYFGCAVGVRTPIYPLYKKITFKNRNYFLKSIGWGTRYIDSLFSRRRMVFATHAYMITNLGCQKLLNLSSTNLYTREKYNGLKIQLPADYLLGYIALNGLKSFCFNENNYVKVIESESQIGQRSAHKFMTK